MVRVKTSPDGHNPPVRRDIFAVRRVHPIDQCGTCERLVPRVWLVPGDVVESCAACYRGATGREPVHEQGHTSVPAPTRPATRATFYLRLDGRRPA